MKGTINLVFFGSILLCAMAAKAEQLPERSLEGACCSFDFVACGGDAWCDESAGNCGICDGEWTNQGSLNNRAQTCIPRWQGCNNEGDGSDSGECCGDAVCLRYNQWWQSCEVPYDCCSWDGETCKYISMPSFLNAGSLHSFRLSLLFL